MSAQKKKGSKSIQTAIKKDVLDTKCQLSELSTIPTGMKASIAAFSDKPQRNSCSEANSVQEDNVSGYAGNYFGGHTSKCTKAWIASPLALSLFSLMILIKSYLLTRLGGHNTARDRIMKTSHIEQVVSSVWHKMVPTRYLSSSRSVRNSDNGYHGRILCHNYVILTYTCKECEVSPYSD